MHINTLTKMQTGFGLSGRGKISGSNSSQKMYHYGFRENYDFRDIIELRLLTIVIVVHVDSSTYLI